MPVRHPRLLWLALALTCLLGWLFKAHCGAYWVGSQQYTTGCYSDALPFWGLRGVAAGQLPYLQARIEYPVLTGGLIWLEGAWTRAIFGRGADAWHFLAVVALVNAGLAAVVLRWWVWAGADDWRLWGWALATPLVLYLGHNWDMLAVALTVGALMLARAERPVAAAAVAGLGVAAKLYPALLLPLLGLGALAARGTGRDRLRATAILSVAAIGAWVLVNAPVAWAAWTNWSEFYRFSGERAPTAASVWNLAREFGGYAPDLPALNRAASLAFLTGFAAIIAAGWRRHRERLWVLFPAVLAWFMLTNKVYSPQFVLWLYPLLLMTLRRRWPIALLAAGDAMAYFAEFWTFAGTEGAWPNATVTHLGLAAAIRAVAMGWAIWVIVRDEPPAWLTRTSLTRTATSPAAG